MVQKITILKHGGGELANQLWNYLSIYAYGLEINAKVQNPSFFEYHSFFNFLPKESLTTRLFSLFFQTPRRRSHIINRWGRAKYAVRSKFVALIKNKCVISSENSENKTTYIPPTAPLAEKFQSCSKLYFSGWLFRNPQGLLKFSKELRAAFTPHKKVAAQVQKIIVPLRTQYSHIIGVHIRQSDYKNFKNGKFIVTQERVRTILNEYIIENALNATKILFVMASDGPIDQTLFRGLNIYVSKENSVTDLFLLSTTDTILGSDSSFGAYAAWYGNIPHIVFKNETIDWAYYKDKNSFFENKYSEMIHL